MQNVLLDKLREGGEKSVVGLTGYYPLNGYDTGRYCLKRKQQTEKPVYVKVKVVGLHVPESNGRKGSCGSPSFVVEPLSGIGSFLLEDGCQFYATKEQIKEEEDEAKREQEAQALFHRLRAERILERRQAVYDAVQLLTPEQREVLNAECEEMKINPDDPSRWAHHHCQKVGKYVMECLYPDRTWY